MNEPQPPKPHPPFSHGVPVTKAALLSATKANPGQWITAAMLKEADPNLDIRYAIADLGSLHDLGLATRIGTSPDTLLARWDG